MTSHRPPGPSVAALWTARGRGAVATIRFEGNTGLIDDADPPLFRAANGRRLGEQRPGEIVFGRWGGSPPEEIVVCRLDETAVEIHTHGGEAAARRVLSDLAARGCRMASWRQLLEESRGVLAAELSEALSRATTLRTATILLEQQSGVLRDEFDWLLALAEGWSADARSAAGCSPDDFGPGAERTDGLGERLDELLQWGPFGLHLTRPWSVVLAGRTNAGKSSLINALVGYPRSIVYDQPGTTRDVVTVETAFDGWPVQLSDTAGIRSADDELESVGIARALQRLATADCRVLLLDVSRPVSDADLALIQTWPEAIVVAHKCDLSTAAVGGLPEHAIPVSSRTGQGVAALIDRIVERLVPNPPAACTPLPVTDRQIAQLSQARDRLNRADFPACHRALAILAGR